MQVTYCFGFYSFHHNFLQPIGSKTLSAGDQNKYEYTVTFDKNEVRKPCKGISAQSFATALTALTNRGRVNFKNNRG